MREWQKVDSALEASLPVLLLPCTKLSFGSSVVEVLVLFRLICMQGNTGSRSKEWFRKLNMSNLQVCLHLWTCDGKKATDEVAQGLGYKSMEINPGSSQSLVMSLPENGNKILAHTSCWVWRVGKVHRRHAREILSSWEDLGKDTTVLLEAGC